VSETYLDMARLALLAPDWTVSNWRFFMRAAADGPAEIRSALAYVSGRGDKPAGVATMEQHAKINKAKGTGRYMAKVLLTFQGVVMAANIAMWGTPFPQDEEDKRLWYMIKLPYTNEAGRHYYLDIYGHFFEPIRAATDPYNWFKGKRSFIWRGAEEQFTGRNWRNDYIGTVDDLLKGKLYRSQYDKWPEPGLLGWKQIPNRVIHGISAFLPIPLKTAGETIVGQRPAIEMLGSTGLKLRLERKKKRRASPPPVPLPK